MSLNLSRTVSLLSLMTLTLLNIRDLLFCGMSLSLDLSVVFSWLDSCYAYLAGISQRDTVFSHCILLGRMWFLFVPLLIVFTFVTCLSCRLSGFSTVKLLSSLCESILWGNTLKPYKNLIPHQNPILFIYLYLYELIVFYFIQCVMLKLLLI